MTACAKEEEMNRQLTWCRNWRQIIGGVAALVATVVLVGGSVVGGAPAAVSRRARHWELGDSSHDSCCCERCVGGPRSGRQWSRQRPLVRVVLGDSLQFPLDAAHPPKHAPAHLVETLVGSIEDEASADANGNADGAAIKLDCKSLCNHESFSWRGAGAGRRSCAAGSGRWPMGIEESARFEAMRSSLEKP